MFDSKSTFITIPRENLIFSQMALMKNSVQRHKNFTLFKQYKSKLNEKSNLISFEKCY